MPKKKSKKEKKGIKKSKILEKLAEELKKEKNKNSFEKKEKKKIEKLEAENNSDLNNFEFNQFVQPMHLEETKAPVLERIAGFQPGPVFVSQVSETSQAISGEEKKKSDETQYVPSQKENNDPKYVESSSKPFREPEKIDFAQIGRKQTEIVPQVDQETFFRSSEPDSQVESPMLEKTWEAKQIDTERAGREDPFKREEIKYEKYKPKLPKGY